MSEIFPPFEIKDKKTGLTLSGSPDDIHPDDLILMTTAIAEAVEQAEVDFLLDKKKKKYHLEKRNDVPMNIPCEIDWEPEIEGITRIGIGYKPIFYNELAVNLAMTITGTHHETSPNLTHEQIEAYNNRRTVFTQVIDDFYNGVINSVDSPWTSVLPHESMMDIEE